MEWAERGPFSSPGPSGLGGGSALADGRQPSLQFGLVDRESVEDYAPQ